MRVSRVAVPPRLVALYLLGSVLLLGAIAGATAPVGTTTSRYLGFVPRLEPPFRYPEEGERTAGDHDIRQDDQLRLQLRTNMDADMTVSTVTVAPGGNVGWHTHNGPVFIVVRRGILTLLDGECFVREVGPGETVLEQGTELHNGYNLSMTMNVEFATVAFAPRGVPQRVDMPAPSPGCSGF
jgi:quercetin dioxygenase-like cupin family protein